MKTNGFCVGGDGDYNANEKVKARNVVCNNKISNNN